MQRRPRAPQREDPYPIIWEGGYLYMILTRCYLGYEKLTSSFSLVGVGRESLGTRFPLLPTHLVPCTTEG